MIIVLEYSNYETKTTLFQKYSFLETLTYGKFSIEKFAFQTDTADEKNV